MTNEQKLQLADIIINYCSQFNTSDEMPIMIGTLNTAQGIKGFEKADIGHPVFEYKGRYIIYLSGAQGHVCVPYYKDSLHYCIDFI
jgi:hypothetical protein